MNNEEKKWDIKRNLEKYLNKELYDKINEKQKISALEYYNEYLSFMPKHLIEAIDDFEQQAQNDEFEKES